MRQGTIPTDLFRDLLGLVPRDALLITASVIS
jgi:hypothetical protein